MSYSLLDRDEIIAIAEDRRKEIDQLKQQLRDKEKERHEEWLTGKEWKWECDRLKRELHTANQETLNFQNKYFTEKQIAIEELKKVKEEFTKEVWDMYDTPDLLEQICEFRNKQIQYIDKQIKELKGENK